jgi:elongation factor Ts
MSNITAKMVADLRQITGLGMMECKKALVESNGDLAKAEEILRIKSGAKAGKVAGRTAAEGMVSIYVSADKKKAVLLEVNCETDFVAKDDNFVNFADDVANAIANSSSIFKAVEEIANITLSNGKTVEETRKDMVAKLGENISIRRFETFLTNGTIATYIHGKKIGVVVDILGGDLELGKDLAMHIAASKPICISKNEVASDKIETERSIYTQQAQQSGKPADIIAKMVEGRINKYLAEITLLGQQFVKDPDVTVEKLLNSKSASVNRFAMYVVGEGIEKKSVDFAAEVAAAAIVG